MSTTFRGQRDAPTRLAVRHRYDDLRRATSALRWHQGDYLEEIDPSLSQIAARSQRVFEEREQGFAEKGRRETSKLSGLAGPAAAARALGSRNLDRHLSDCSQKTVGSSGGTQRVRELC